MPNIKTINKSASQKFWSAQISQALKREEKWRESGGKIVKRYRDDGSSCDKSFNILWSNTEVLKAATFSRKPEPNVARRFKDDGGIARSASELLERCLEFYSDESEFTNSIRNARDDMLLPGRGVVWVEYDASFERFDLEPIEVLLDEETGETAVNFAIEGVFVEPDGFDDEENRQGAFIEQLSTESVELKYVFWKDFLQSDSRDWNEVWWVARKHGLDVDELKDMFGEDVTAKIEASSETESDSQDNRRQVYAVWEIWDKNRKERVWYTDGAIDTLEREEVPLDLSDFFPCTKPLFPFETTDTMVPVPEFFIYQDQADELDLIEGRLSRLTKALKAVGVYNAKNGQDIDLSGHPDGTLVPVNMAEFGTDGKLADQIQYLPLLEIAGVIDKLEARKLVLKSEIYELTGISDIIRGDTDAGETAAAQRLKGSFGSLRLRPRREPVEEMVRDIYRIMTEVIADKFSPQTITAITGLPVDPEVEQFMRNDTLRTFRIDVETDSTVQPNQELDKRRALEFTQAVGTLFQQVIPAVRETPELAEMAAEMLKHTVQQFKAGRTLEGIIDQTIDNLKNAAQQPQQEGPTPEQQIEMLRLQNEQQGLVLENKKIDAELQLKQADMVITNQNNETDIIQDSMRTQAQVDTALIEQQTSNMDNETKLAVEGLKTVQNSGMFNN